MRKSLVMLLMLVSALAFAQITKPQTIDSSDIGVWGTVIISAVSSNSIEQIHASGRAIKVNPSRIVDVKWTIQEKETIRNLLNSVANLLVEQKFEISDRYNLPKVSVRFEFILRDVCTQENAKFELMWTMEDYFYIGCRSKLDSLMARIRSPELDSVLRKTFPEELVVNER